MPAVFLTEATLAKHQNVKLAEALPPAELFLANIP
jgi:hypothetical protein